MGIDGTLFWVLGAIASGLVALLGILLPRRRPRFAAGPATLHHPRPRRRVVQARDDDSPERDAHPGCGHTPPTGFD
ncbi:hypothetical protein ACFP2T_22010 [Plantactinospora solaniradicis]|uniref:Uncharacterized protein n=1 Tax=Plantactinospora solaniradicis TaxID=1723736 RepID=A0ABW1KBA2_9ACTN